MAFQFVNAQVSQVYQEKGIAINGYDVVMYFTESKPVKGSNNYLYQWNNATWFFSSKANLDSFIINPEKYAPQFGGYCAYGISEGHKSPTDPFAWTILNNKLYLNYNLEVMDLWRNETVQRIKLANINWEDLKNK